MKNSLLDPASEEEVAREIPAARRRGGGYGGEISAGLREAAAGETLQQEPSYSNAYLATC